MSLYLSRDNAKEFLDAGWEVDNTYQSNSECSGYFVYPRANFLVAVELPKENSSRHVEIQPGDVFALRMLNPSLWDNYLLPLRKEQNK